MKSLRKSTSSTTSPERGNEKPDKSVKRAPSLKKLTNLVRRMSGGGEGIVGNPEEHKPLYARTASGGSLRISSNPSSSPLEALISPRSLAEVTKAPPVATQFDVNLANNFPVLLSLFCEVLESSDTSDEEKLGLFVPLVEILKMHDHLIKCVSYIANGEAKKCQDPNTLFRETTPLVLLCRAICTSQRAHFYLEPLVQKSHDILWATGADDEPLTAERVEAVLDMLAGSLNECPVLLRLFFQNVYSIVNVRHAGFGSMALANFFFLRFLLPAVVSPGEMLPPDKQPNAAQRKRVLMAAKVLQVLANGVTPEPDSPLAEYVCSKQQSGWADRFFINLITARPDDSVSEVGNTLEFVGPEFSPLRDSLFSWVFRHLDGIRERLGPSLQLHSWLQDNASVRDQMQQPIMLGRLGNQLAGPSTSAGSGLLTSNASTPIGSRSRSNSRLLRKGSGSDTLKKE